MTAMNIHFTILKKMSFFPYKLAAFVTIAETRSSLLTYSMG